MTEPPPHVFICGVSRSGTTLLATILDSHPDISLGYELIPAPLPAAASLTPLIEQAWDESGGRVRRCGNLLRSRGQIELGTFIKRCYRARVLPNELIDLLRRFDHPADDPIRTIEARLQLAMQVVSIKRHKEATKTCGFKIGINDIARMERLCSGAVYLCAMRDPRDVVVSQLKRGFKRSPRQIADSWTAYCLQLHRWQRRLGDRLAVVRYEDLVARPACVLDDAFSRLGIGYDSAVLRFFASKASVHQPGQSHANAEALRQDFFTSSIGQWSSLPAQDIEAVERITIDEMLGWGYAPELVNPQRSSWRSLRNRIRSIADSLRSAIR